MSASAAYVTFRLGGDRVALPVSRVKEIYEPEAVTRVPGAPKAVRGVVNLRGAVVAVVDLAAALGLREPPAGVPRCLLLLELNLDGERSLIGLACDAVEEVIDLAPEDVEPAPAFGTRVSPQHLLGLGRSAAGFVELLQVDQALASTLVRVPEPLAAGGAQR